MNPCVHCEHLFAPVQPRANMLSPQADAASSKALVTLNGPQGDGATQLVAEGDEPTLKVEDPRTASLVGSSELGDTGSSDIKPTSANTNKASQFEEQVRVDAGSATAHWQAVQTSLGEFVETVEAQVGLILLIAFDVCAAAADIYIRNQLELANYINGIGTDGVTSVQLGVAETGLIASIAAWLLQASGTITMAVFVLELSVLAAVFKRKFVAHTGYLLDAVLVATAVAMEMWTQSKAARLLGVLRVWRIFRVVKTVVDRERLDHEATKSLLDRERADVIHLRLEKQSAEESLKREFASRAGLEKLLYEYKDEVATLKEALEIAARAVAEAELATTAYGGYQEADPIADAFLRQELQDHDDDELGMVDLDVAPDCFDGQPDAAAETPPYDEDYWQFASPGIDDDADSAFEDAVDISDASFVAGM